MNELKADNSKDLETSKSSQNFNKLKILKESIEIIDKEYGPGTIMKLTGERIKNISSISTGSLSLDIALGVGGLPRGRIIEIYGPESSGKTTLSLQCISEAQKLGGIAAFIDAEHAFDENYAKNLNIDFNKLFVSQPSNAEEALDIVYRLINSGTIDVCVIDSVAALLPKAEIEGDFGTNKVGVLARIMSQALRKLTGIISKTNCVCIFINQLREKIGVMFGSPETTPGGNALKFYASVRLDIRKSSINKSSIIKDSKSGDAIGNRTKVKVVKNKVAPPFKTVEFDILYGKGVDTIGEIVDIGIEKEIIKKNGSWFYLDDVKLSQGRDSLVIKLKEDKILCKKIKDLILNK